MILKQRFLITNITLTETISCWMTHCLVINWLTALTFKHPSIAIKRAVARELGVNSAQRRQTCEMCCSRDWMSFTGSLKKTFSCGFIWNRKYVQIQNIWIKGQSLLAASDSNLQWRCQTHQPCQRWADNCSWLHTRHTALWEITRSVQSLNLSHCVKLWI